MADGVVRSRNSRRNGMKNNGMFFYLLPGQDLDHYLKPNLNKRIPTINPAITLTTV